MSHAWTVNERVSRIDRRKLKRRLIQAVVVVGGVALVVWYARTRPERPAEPTGEALVVRVPKQRSGTAEYGVQAIRHGRPMLTREEVLAEAEAEIHRRSDVLDGRERDLGAAWARAEIENESFTTPEEEAEISERHAVAEREIERLQQEVSEAEDDAHRANETWEHYVWESGDNPPDEDDDTGSDEALSVHDAADIWRSHGMDEDYTFGYNDTELRRAADRG